MLVLCCAVVAKAQNEAITAVLQHGDDVSVFAGMDAFIQAHEAAGEDPYDLFIVDYQMPISDGFNFVKGLPANMQSIPKILMHPLHFEESNRLHAEEIGFNSCLAKPIQISSLLTAMQEAVGEKPIYQKAVKKEKRKIYFKDAKVLLVEDNKMNQELAVSLLSSGRSFSTVVLNRCIRASPFGHLRPRRSCASVAPPMTVSLCCRLFLSHFSSAVENYNLHGRADMGLKMVSVG